MANMSIAEKNKIKERAIELGLSTVAISYVNLKEAIRNIESKGNAAESIKEAIRNIESKENAVESIIEKEEVEEESGDVNTAVVYNIKNEVRRYAIDTHGKDFKVLAKEFADKKEYRVEFKNVESAVLCPHCGGKIYRD